MTSPPPVDSTHTHAASNGKRTLTLEELTLTQPGMDRLQAELGPRMHRLAYAGRAGNWPLAAYYYRSVVKQLKLSAVVRPRYAAAMDRYLAEDCPPVRAAVDAADAAAFRVAYDHMVARANDFHAEFDKPFIVWRTPDSPPEDLDLTAGLG